MLYEGSEVVGGAEIGKKSSLKSNAAIYFSNILGLNVAAHRRQKQAQTLTAGYCKIW